MFKIIGAVLLVQYVPDGGPPSRPSAARPVIDTEGEALESTTRLRAAKPSNVLRLPMPPHAGLDMWCDRQGRAGR